MPTRVTRRRFLGDVAKGAAALALTMLPSWARAAAGAAGGMDRPNFLFINTDQQRVDTLRAYGCDFALTPNIDQLAAEGVRFDRCYIS
ncbi:MAG TPA: sulfatase-like hydrolase/transferase, partial [Armatimonadota bacterium]|nr:sulfatase-like hydrolase/transferase [Armatimonadota bacterium]